jgi:hypothetical protein
MKPSLWLALTLLVLPRLAEAQTATGADAPDKQTDYNKIVARFFEMVKAGRFTDAAHALIDTNLTDAFNVEKHESLAVPLQKIQDAFGPFKEFKPLVTKTLGDGVGYVYGLAIYERGPIRYEFMFYKDGPDWRLLHIDFNLNYVPEIRELAGVHIPIMTPAPYPEVKPKPPASQAPSTPASPAPAQPAAQTPSPPAAPSSRPAAAPAPSPAPTPPATDPALSPAPQN